MVIAFWDKDSNFIRETTYTTLAEQVIGYIDMIDTVKSGGWCLAGSLMITNIKQLLPTA